MFDTRPLDHDPSPEEAADIQRRLRAGDYGPDFGGLSRRAGWIAAGVVTALWGLVIALPWILGFNHGYTTDAWLTGVAGSAFVVVVGWAFAIDFIEGYRERRRDRRALPRLAAFARVNELQFARRIETVPPGRVFSGPSSTGSRRAGGRNRTADHESRVCFRAPAGPLLETGRHTWKRGRKDEPASYVCSYLVFGLPRKLPRLFAQRAGQRGYLDPVLPIADAQRSVGPEFAARYTVYGPSTWNPTELSLFSYDLIELLDRLGGEFDIEVSGQFLVLYTERDLDLADPRTWQAIDLVADRIIAPLSAPRTSFTTLPPPLVDSGSGPSFRARWPRRSLRRWQSRALVVGASVLTELVCAAVRWAVRD